MDAESHDVASPVDRRVSDKTKTYRSDVFFFFLTSSNKQTANSHIHMLTLLIICMKSLIDLVVCRKRI